MLIADLQTLLLRHSQQAYSLELEVGAPAGACASKFGGEPYFESDTTEWPMCSKCLGPLYFICQMNFKEPALSVLPIAKWFGLVTFFYCWKCYPYESHMPGWLARNYVKPDAARAVRFTMPEVRHKGADIPVIGALFSPKVKPTIPCSVRFEEFTDVPDPEEMELLTDEAGRALLRDEDISDEYFEAAEGVTGKLKEFGTICGGFSHWIQGMEETGCSVCHGRLMQLMQIGSEETAGLMWGDAGAVYLRFCSQHPEQIYLFSQCF